MSILRFRAWHRKEQRMMSPIDLYHTGQVVHATPGSGFKEPLHVGLEVDLMQSTGVEDQKGQEIFEGDIVQFQSEIKYLLLVRVITYDAECGRFSTAKCGDEEGEYLGRYDAIVLGNLFEHPQFLEAQP